MSLSFHVQHERSVGAEVKVAGWAGKLLRMVGFLREVKIQMELHVVLELQLGVERLVAGEAGVARRGGSGGRTVIKIKISRFRYVIGFVSAQALQGGAKLSAEDTLEDVDFIRMNQEVVAVVEGVVEGLSASKAGEAVMATL